MRKRFFRNIGLISISLCCFLWTACSTTTSQSDAQALFEEKYKELQNRESLHYTVEQTHEYRNRAFGTSTINAWCHGEDYLHVYTNDDGRSEYSLAQGGNQFRAESAQPVQFPEWKSGITYGPRNVWGTKWEDFEYVFESASRENGQLNITYFKDHGSGNCTVSRQTSRITMHLDENNVLQSITYVFTTYQSTDIDESKVSSVKTSIYTLLQDDAAAVADAIDEQYQKIIKESKIKN